MLSRVIDKDDKSYLAVAGYTILWTALVASIAFVVTMHNDAMDLDQRVSHPTLLVIKK